MQEMISQKIVAEAITAMEAFCKREGHSGVACALVVWNADLTALTQYAHGTILPMVKVIGKTFDIPEPDEGKGDLGVNLLATVMAQIAEMIRTRRDSGTTEAPPIQGELGLKGGICDFHRGNWIFVAFSGGSSEVNTRVASIGAAYLYVS